MRAIDADDLRDRLQNLGYDDWNQGVTTTWAEAFKECADMVDEQPTIEPRKKGKWINIREGNRADCDQCGQSGRAWMNFCFDCGADMREPEDIPMEYFENGGR